MSIAPMGDCVNPPTLSSPCCADLKTFSAPRVSALLAFYQIPADGSLDNRRSRLARAIGCRL